MGVGVENPTEARPLRSGRDSEKLWNELEQSESGFIIGGDVSSDAKNLFCFSISTGSSISEPDSSLDSKSSGWATGEASESSSDCRSRCSSSSQAPVPPDSGSQDPLQSDSTLSPDSLAAPIPNASGAKSSSSSKFVKFGWLTSLSLSISHPEPSISASALFPFSAFAF